MPVLVEDDWKAALLWKALYDAGVFVNVALHPAVPPGGALLRTSVMATHDRATLDRALGAFASVKAAFEAEHGPLPGPAARTRRPPRPRSPRRGLASALSRAGLVVRAVGQELPPLGAGEAPPDGAADAGREARASSLQRIGSQSLIVRSSPAVASCRPSGLNATVLTQPVCPSSGPPSGRRVGVPQPQHVVGADGRRVLPSGLKATQWTASV